MLDATEKMVKGNSTNGIGWNGSSYFVMFNGDKVGTFGNDISYAEKVYNEKMRKK